MKNPYLSAKGFRQLIGNYYDHLQEEERQRLIASIYIIMTLVTVSFFGIFAIYPTLTTISQLQQQYTDDSHVDQALKQKLASLQKLDYSYQQIEPNLPILYLAIPQTAKIPYLTAQLEKLATGNSLVVNETDVNPIEIYPAHNPNSPLFSFSFTIVVEGSQTQVNKFLTQLINFDRIVDLEDLNTTQGDDNATRTTIVGKAFFYPK